MEIFLKLCLFTENTPTTTQPVTTTINEITNTAPAANTPTSKN